MLSVLAIAAIVFVMGFYLFNSTLDELRNFFITYKLGSGKRLRFGCKGKYEKIRFLELSVNSFIDLMESSHEKVVALLNMDKLTSLKNRTAFSKDAEMLPDGSWILFLDLDGFKLVNDIYGHDAGDRLLKDVSARLLEIKDDTMSVYRLGGDEFVITAKKKSEEEVRVICSKIILNIGKDLMVDNLPVNISTSIGVSQKKSRNDYLKEADIAMYEAKRVKKVPYLFYTDEMAEKINHKLKLIRDIKEGVENDEFYFVLQPQVDIETGNIVAAEALIRWKYKGQRDLTPGYFIDELENSHHMITIGYRLMRRIFEEAKRLNIKIAINLSDIQIADAKFMYHIYDILHKVKTDPSLIEFEITERWKNIDNEEVVQKLNALSELGFSLSIDDFGTRNSSFGRTDTLPINKIKLDKSFSDRLFTSPTSYYSVKSISSYAKDMGRAFVAEGVETIDQVHELRKLGVRYIQGYVFYKPLQISEFEEELKNRKNVQNRIKKALREENETI